METRNSNKAERLLQRVILESAEDGSIKEEHQGYKVASLDDTVVLVHLAPINSSKTHKILRKSGILLLPSQHKFRDYSHCINSEAGFSSDVDRMLAKAANVRT